MAASDQNQGNQRINTRVEFDTQITLRIENEAFHIKGNSRDISLKGIFVNTDLDIAKGTMCTIEIHLTGMVEPLALEISGEIIRKESKGLAILFTSMELESFTHLKNIVRYNTTNPDTIQ